MSQSDAYSFEHLSHVLNGVGRHDSRTLMSSKNVLISNNLKENGNKYCALEDYRNGLTSYNQALCYAENGSEVAGLLYAIRSAVALEVKSYPECLKNIQLAREHNYPKQSLDILIKREEKCKEMMSTKDSSRNGYAIFLKLLYGSNIEGFMIDCLKIDYNKNGTRCLTTARDLKTGDLIAVQKPFSGFLFDYSLYRYCLNCLKECVFDLIPCDGCKSVMFCSKNCKETAFEVHQYECEVMGIFKNEVEPSIGIHLNMCRALFKALSLFNGSAYKMKKYLEEKTDEASGKCTMNINDICNNEKVFLKAVNSLDKDTIGDENLEDFLLLYPKMRKILMIPELRNFIISFTSKIKIAATIAEGFGNERNGGYYPLQTFMDFSCAPNVLTIDINNGKTIFIAQNPIKAGEKLTISIKSDSPYWFKNKLDRQRDYFHYFQKKCDCVACVENYPMHLQQKFTSSIDDVINRLRDADLTCGYDAFKLHKKNCEYIDAHFDESPCYEISTTLFINQVLFARLGLLKKVYFNTL